MNIPDGLPAAPNAGNIFVDEVRRDDLPVYVGDLGPDPQRPGERLECFQTHDGRVISWSGHEGAQAQTFLYTQSQKTKREARRAERA